MPSFHRFAIASMEQVHKVDKNLQSGMPILVWTPRRAVRQLRTTISRAEYVTEWVATMNHGRLMMDMLGS